jgi:hypothetical protein
MRRSDSAPIMARTIAPPPTSAVPHRLKPPRRPNALAATSTVSTTKPSRSAVDNSASSRANTTALPSTTSRTPNKRPSNAPRGSSATSPNPNARPEVLGASHVKTPTSTRMIPSERRKSIEGKLVASERDVSIRRQGVALRVCRPEIVDNSILRNSYGTVTLSSQESAMAQALLQSEGRLVSRAELERALWPDVACRIRL